MESVARVLASPRVAGWRRSPSGLETSSTHRSRRSGGARKRTGGASGTGYSRRLAGLAIACGTLAVAACGSTSSSSTFQPTLTAPAPVSAGTQMTPLAQTPGSVPAEYLSQYTSVEADAQAFEGMAGGSSSGGTTTVGAELLAANGTTLVGAGSGTWSSTSIDQALLTTPIDYLDVHVYPLAPADLTNLTSDGAAAKAAHKPLVMDETWLYKDLTSGNFGPGGTSQFNASGPENEMKDVSFSFWEPLDESYVAAMVSYVRSQGFSYVAFFDGARCFFGYLTWSSELDDASYPTFSQEYNQVVAANLAGPAVSGTGLSLQNAIVGR
jgi:hypothetical protein